MFKFPEKYNNALNNCIIYNSFLFMNHKETQFYIKHACLVSWFGFLRMTVLEKLNKIRK